MGLKEQKLQFPELRQASLGLLIEGERVLLAMKKRGFGQGKWNGVGGKPNEGEKIEVAADREVLEEIGVEVVEKTEAGRINFYFQNRPEWNQQVVVYRVNSWRGIPRETEEMAPKWIDFDKVPYEEMWEDDKYWLPTVLDGNRMNASFFFDENEKLLEVEIRGF